RYADLQPAWSPDGTQIAFTTDRGPGGTDFRTLDYANLRLAVYDLGSEEIRILEPFGEALHHNPQYSPDGQSLFFISDHDGFKDIYRLALDSEAIYRITNIATGVSGITSTSPAMSVAMQSGRMMFSVFSDNMYTVFSLERSQLVGEPITPEPDQIATAAILPPIRALNEGLVGNYLADPLTGLPPADAEFASSDYDPTLHLDFVAPPTVGVSAGGTYGTRLGGGVGFFFSDMLGNRNLTIAAQAQGTLKDIGAQVTYLDLGNRLNFGGTVGHIPILFGYVQGAVVPGGQLIEQLRMRIFIDQLSGIAQYPLSTSRRIEASGGFIRYGFDNEVEQYFVDFTGGVGRKRVKPEDSEFWQTVGERDPIYFALATLAYVGDYSFFGFTSPVRGGRYRFHVAPQVGSQTYVSTLADYRRYLMFVSPLTLAYRGLHIGNYGADPNDLFSTNYLGYSYYPGFVRGYNINSFEAQECNGGGASCFF
ncbi:MAG: peptidase S9, partial [Rhodothermales bacterium]